MRQQLFSPPLAGGGALHPEAVEHRFPQALSTGGRGRALCFGGLRLARARGPPQEVGDGIRVQRTDDAPAAEQLTERADDLVLEP
jgi:hypothetical protein